VRAVSTFTLDTNCLIAVDEGRPEAAAIQTLATAHAEGRANVAVVAISASENQQDRRYIRNFAEFQYRLATLELSHLNILRPMFYWDITFWDWAYWSDESMEALERKIHDVLFPNVEFLWRDFCRAVINPPPEHASGKWRNSKCDVQALWSHIYAGQEVFVTSDGNFHATTKKAALIALGAQRIEYPADAIALM
jgi:hypothetical protein